MFNIYQNVEDFDGSELIKASGIGDPEKIEWPSSKKFKVTEGKNVLEISTYFTQAKKKSEDIDGCYDAYTAISMMLTMDEAMKEFLKYHSPESDAIAYVRPEFDKNTPRITEEQVAQRMKFIKAVAMLISNQETMEAIAAAAPRKKNGTFYKGRVTKIACAGFTDDWNAVYAIVARAKDDCKLSIVFEEHTTDPDELEKWNNDFISTYHEGLPISEALKKLAQG